MRWRLVAEFGLPVVTDTVGETLRSTSCRQDGLRLKFGKPRGAGLGVLLSTGTSAWELHATDRTRLAYGEPPYADQWYWQDKESLSIRHFLEQLDEATAYRLSQISQPDMAHLLRAAVAHLPEVRGFDFGEHGVVLTTSPGLTLWRVYDYIARNAGI